MSNLKDKKRVLFFIDWYFPAFKAGGPISSVRNLCLLLKSDYEVLVVTGDRDLGDLSTLPGIVTNEIVNVEGINIIYLSPDQINASKYEAIFSEFKPDVIHLNSLFSARFTILPLKTFKNKNSQIIISPRGMFGKASLRIKSLKKKVFFTYAKTTSLFKGVKWHATSPIEAEEIKRKLGNKTNVVIANNVPYLPLEKVPSPEKKVGEVKLLSVGRMAPIKNFEFLLNSLTSVVSQVYLLIVGPVEDKSYAEKCQIIANQLPQHINIRFLDGMSPTKLNELYSDSHIFISASKNENFGHSIAEALGSGRPVIVSEHTPWKDLSKKGAGFDLPLDEEKFADKIEYFASLNQEAFEEFTDNARKTAVEVAQPEILKQSYQVLYEP